MGSALLLIGVLGVCVLMLWVSYRIEPHWVSKDGDRVICYGQALSRNGQTSGRWRELRITKVRDDTVEVRTRRGSLAIDRPAGNPLRPAGSAMRSAGNSMRPTGDAMRSGRSPLRMGGIGTATPRHMRKATYWKVSGQTACTMRNRVMYMLDGNDDAHMPEMIAIRLPAKSKAIPMLEAMSVKRSESSSRQSPGMTQSADQPDQD